MPKRYETRDGDMLDDIAFRHYGYHRGTVEAILEANRDLSAHPPMLPGGLVIVLPDLPSVAERAPKTVRLWD
ncbi:MAG: tail protein X [Hyphomicrobiaceae bacterium]|nr:tail protein X [Hyphomicrobiaceae bacterium]